MTLLQFPPGFVWGTATSAFQIEGATAEDGRGESIWDRFARTPGAIRDGTSPAEACDHYHRYAEDVALMGRLGARGARTWFSVAWPRVIPDGIGPVNTEKGLDFYSRLVDRLLEAGITPYVTLYHWDLPQVVEDEGGWTSRATAEHFVRFADVVHEAPGRPREALDHPQRAVVRQPARVQGGPLRPWAPRRRGGARGQPPSPPLPRLGRARRPGQRAGGGGRGSPST